MSFSMIHTGGPYGDCMSSYDVKLDREYTVKEFIEEVLKEKSNEWGEFVITKDFKYIYSNANDTCEYKYKEIKKELNKTENGEKAIKEIKAHGGWTRMDYYIMVQG